MRTQDGSTFKQHVKLAYRLYQLPKELRPYTCWKLFQYCRNGEHAMVAAVLETAENLYKAERSGQENFDDLVDGMS